MFEFQFMPGFWDFFRTYAPSIPMPSIYWNVVSAEQRVHMLCKWLGVLIEYCNATGQQVDEIKKTLDDIIEGKLDPIIQEAIAQWFIDNEPEIMEDIADLKAEDIAINARIDLIESGHMLVFGDSLSTPDYDPFIKWPVYLADALGIDQSNVHNYAKSGAGFYVANNTLQMQLNTAIADASTGNYANAVEYIYVYAGGNDTSRVSSMTPQQYINSIINYLIVLHDEFPKAKIYYAFSGSRYSRGNYNTWAFSNFNCYWHNLYSLMYSYIITNVTYCPAILIDIDLPLLRNEDYYSAPNYHPGAHAQMLMANSILQQMHGNAVQVLNSSHTPKIYDGIGTSDMADRHGTDITDSIDSKSAVCLMDSNGNVKMRIQADYLTIPANSSKTFAMGCPAWLKPGAFQNIRVSNVNVYYRLGATDSASVLDNVTAVPYSLSPTYNEGFADFRIRNNNNVDAHLITTFEVEYACRTQWNGQV